MSLKKLFAVYLLSMAGTALFARAIAEDSAGMNGAFSSSVPELVRSAVFEVVVKKVPDTRIVFDKELDWSVVPYLERTDEYLSIGTAFAVSPVELATAFHVIDLGAKSPVHNDYYIRDDQQNVYEVDRITAGSNERDFLFFTVKGKTFDRYFEFERSFKKGEAVWSIGNAFGEGIIVRDGLVLGTTPEDEEGRWEWLKSSSGVSPGNSGGPLVNRDGKVVALVTSRKDNVLYSTPAQVILDAPQNALVYRRHNVKYTHDLLQNWLNRTFALSLPLPDGYKTLQDQIVSAYEKHYDEAMEALFAEAPEYITGPNNRFLLDSILTVDFPAIDQVDENDDNWVVQRLYGSEQQLANDGKIKHGSWWSSAFGGLNLQLIKIKRPNTEGVERINTDPQVIMDLFLQNVRHDFTLTYGYDYRILSLGEPRSTGEFRDAQGRTWITAFWMVNHSEKMYLAYILPQPGGPVVLISEPDIFSRSDGGDLHIFDWDIRKVCDHLHIPYSGTFEEWNEFLKLSRYVPDFLKEFKFDWQDDTRRITFALPDFSVSLGPQVFDWTDASYLFIAPAYYRQNGVVQFGVNHVRIDRDFIGNDYSDDYISIRKKLKPDERMDRAAKKEWQDVVSKKAPYNEKPVINADNYGRIRTVFNVKPPADDVCYTLLLGKENTADQDITERFAMLKSGISFAEYAKARAVRPLYGTGIFRYTAL